MEVLGGEYLFMHQMHESEYSQGWFLTISDVAFEQSRVTLIFSCLSIHVQTSLSGLDFQKNDFEI